MYSVVKSLPANTTGRDFVVGDLHGSLALLQQAMAEVSFDPVKDRLFSVGDLVDRGPSSFECLSLLKNPWFFAVPGNHEGMLLTYLGVRGSDYHSGSDFIYNGGDWLLNLDRARRQEVEQVLVPILDKLPLVYLVEDESLPFAVVHAERMGKKANGVVTDEELATVNFNDVYTPFTWGRRMASEARRAVAEKSAEAGIRVSDNPLEPGSRLTYTGHTIQADYAVLHRSHLFIDRGAYKHVEGSTQHCLMMVQHREVELHLKAQGVL